MRIAHFSDLHVLALAGAGPARFLNKRLSGYMNLRLKRGHVHRSSYVKSIAKEIARARVDHVAITGDLTNLALEGEFAAVRDLLEECLGLDPRDVSIVPGNHDLYTRGAMRSRRFLTYFAPYVKGDLPDIPAEGGLGAFPFVRIRGACAIIGMSSAVPRPPFMASGALGTRQLDAFRRALAHPEVERRTPVVLLHHPAHNPRSRLKTILEGLWDADRLTSELQRVPHGLVLHGHLHRRQRRPLATRGGEMHVVGATSASLDHELGERMAGFNLYAFDGKGQLASVEAHVLDPKTETFDVADVPHLSW